jgi:hypothetical protein
MALTTPRSSSKTGPEKEIAVAEVIWFQSQLMAESAVVAKALATLEKTELVTEAPKWPIDVATWQMGSSALTPVQAI